VTEQPRSAALDGRVRRTWRRLALLPRQQRRWSAVAAVVVVSPFAAAALTGITLADWVWAAVLSGGAALVGSHAKRGPLLLAAGIATAVARGPLGLACGLVAVGAGTVSTFHLERQAPFTRGLAAGASVLALLATGDRANPWVMAGASVVVAVLVAASGFRSSPQEFARRFLAVGIGLVGLLLIATLTTAVGGVSARRLADRGADALDRGLDAARAGDAPEARRQLETARDALQSAEDELRRWGIGALVVPGASQNIRAITDVLGEAAEVTRQASAVAARADVDGLTLRSGRLDLEEVAALEAPLRRLSTSLGGLLDEIDHWDRAPLASPIRDRLDDLAVDVRRAGDDADIGAEAATTVPRLLGAEGPRRYLVLLTSPAEARGRFGFPATYAEVVADGGQIRFLGSGRITDLDAGAEGFDQSAFPLDDPDVAPYELFGATRRWRSVTIPPDLTTVSQSAATMWSLGGRPPIDGVIRLDPTSMAELLDLTGPVRVPGRTEEFTAESLEEYLLVGQYVEFEDANAPRREVLEELAGVVFDRLVSTDLPSPRGLVDALGPAVRGDHLHITAFDDDARAFLTRVGLAGEFSAPAVDGLMVTNVNAVGNKIDTFLRTETTYDASYDPETGRLEGTVEIELTNTAPGDGLPDYVIGSAGDADLPTGTNRTTLLVYTAVPVAELEVGGQPGVPRSTATAGWWLHIVSFDVAPGATETVRLSVAGTLPAESRYSLDIRPGGAVTPQRYVVSIDTQGDEMLELDDTVDRRTVLRP
jgi:hypothetical protein